MDEIIEEVMEMKTGELDDFSRILILDTLDNENRYIQYINETLKDWSFERLGVLEQADPADGVQRTGSPDGLGSDHH